MSKLKKVASLFLILFLLISSVSSVAFARDFSIPTDSEKAKVEAEILKLQSSVFYSLKTYLEKLSLDFERLSNYEESGNSSFHLSYNQSELGSGSLDIYIDNYKSKVATFDSDTSGDFKFRASHDSHYLTGFEVDLSTSASAVSKNGETYVLLKDLSFRATDESIAKLLDELKNQFSDGKYIKLPSKKDLNLDKPLSLTAYLKEVEKVLSKPLLTAHLKSGNKYTLVPTKHACDVYFELFKKFSFPSYGFKARSCDRSVYRSFVRKFIGKSELYLIFGSENTFKYLSKGNDATFDLTLSYSEKSISKFDLIITPDQKKFENEISSFHFKSGEYLKIVFNIEKGKGFLNFDSVLDKNNNLIEFSSSIKSSKISGGLYLKDRKIAGFYVLKGVGLSYTGGQNSEDELKNVYGIKITGSTTSENKLEKLNLKFAGINPKAKNLFFSGKLSYKAGNFVFDLSSDNNHSIFKVDGNGFIDNMYLELYSKFNVYLKPYSEYVDFKKTSKHSNSTLNGDANYTMDFNLLIDQKDNKNNLDLKILLNEGKNNLLKLLLKGSTKREYKDDLKIEAPKDYKELDMQKLRSLN